MPDLFENLSTTTDTSTEGCGIWALGNKQSLLTGSTREEEWSDLGSSPDISACCSSTNSLILSSPVSLRICCYLHQARPVPFICHIHALVLFNHHINISNRSSEYKLLLSWHKQMQFFHLGREEIIHTDMDGIDLFQRHKSHLRTLGIAKLVFFHSCALFAMHFCDNKMINFQPGRLIEW